MAIALLALLAGARHARAQQPLCERIDAAISGAAGGLTIEKCNDADFLRRIYVDLVGMVPTAEEARAFLADQAADKRDKLIDRLLADPRFAWHMADVLDVMLMERRPGKNIKDPQWHEYLRASLAEHKPLDQLAREILGADGVDPAQRAAARFYLDRDMEANLVTRDLGRIFFGRDMQCAQCHDHPHIDDYVQADYYGLLAFVSRSYAFQDKAAKPAQTVIAEKAEGDVNYQSVFDPSSKGVARPKLPLGAPLDEPSFPKGEEYEVKPAKDVRPVPKFSRRALLAKAATSGQSVAFNRNLANRLWRLMMGRGLVEPVDLHHSGNPPSHPKLLDDLAAELVAMKFDLHAMLGQLARSRTYQRKLDLPAALGQFAQAAAADLSAQEAEQAQRQAAADEAAEALDAARSDLKTARQAAAPLADQVAKRAAAVQQAQKQADETAQSLAAAQKQLAAQRETAALVADAAGKTKAALAKLPGDAVLTETAQKLEARAAALGAEADKTAKAVADQTAANKQKQDALAAAQAQAQSLAAQLTEANKQVEAATARMTQAAAEANSTKAAVAAQTRHLSGMHVLADYAQSQAALGAARAAIDKINTQLADNRAAVERFKAELEQARSNVAEATTASTATDAALAKAQEELAAKNESAASVAAAAAKAAEAQSKLPDDPVLAEAAKELKAKADTLAAATKTTEQQVAAAQEAAKAAAEKLAGATDAMNKASTGMGEAEKQVQALSAQVEPAKQRAETCQLAADESTEKVSGYCSENFLTSVLKPLSPEQMAWSTMQVLGQVDRTRAEAQAALEKKPAEGVNPPPPEELAVKVQQQVYEKLKGNQGVFVNLFGAGAGQPQSEFFATVDQALFFANGGQMQGWLKPGGGNLTERLLALEDPHALAEELYLSVLTRRPGETEAADVAQYLERQKDQRGAAVQEMVWGLLTSTEFRFNH